MNQLFYKYFSSPLGEIEIKHTNDFIYAFSFINEGASKHEEAQTQIILVKEAEK